MGGKWEKRGPNIQRAGRPFKDNYMHYKPREVLTMEELKQLYEMHIGGCNVTTICIYMRIHRVYALECLQAAKWLYSGELKKMQQERKRMETFETKQPAREPQIFFKDDARGVYKRPPAVYTNQRPYDFDK